MFVLNFQEHEKTCGNDEASESDDDDVIFCGEEEVQKPEDNAMQQNSFLQHFQLFKNIPEDVKPILTSHKRTSQTSSSSSAFGNLNNNNTTLSNKNGCLDVLADKKPRKPVHRRAPGIMVMLKNQIPITSPAGQILIAQANTPITEDYVRERIERYERFCPAPPLAPDCSNRPKFLDKKPVAYTISTFRSNTKHYHCYKFPRRQFSSKLRNEAVAQLERIQLQESKCKPVRIPVQRLSHKEIEDLRTQVKVKRRKVEPNNAQAVIDFIDLCSEDELMEEESENSQDSSETSSSSTRVGPRAWPVQSPQQTLLFVDCSLPADTYATSIMDQRLQLNTSRTKYDSASNLIGSKIQRSAKLFTSTNRSVDLQQIQQDKENRLYSYISEQSNHQQTAAYMYPDDELNMSNTIVPTSLTSNNLISIDLTL